MTSDPQKRAQRLLRVYPASWRRRFGDEFAALMEDELAERPRCATRTLDVMRTGLMARSRSGDFGPTDRTGWSDQCLPGVLVATDMASITCVSVLFTAAAIHPWAFATLVWHGWSPERPGVVQTVTTSIMTFALIGLVGVLSVGILVLAAASAGRMLRRSEWRLGPAVAGLVLGMGGLVVSSTHLLQFVIARGGIEWSNPGLALKQLAGAAYVAITSITATTFAPHVGLSYDLWRIAPVLSIGVIGVSAACLIRRLSFGPRSVRMARIAVVSLTTLMVLLVASYLAWFFGANVHVFGGNDSFESVAFIGMLIAGVVGVACARSTARSSHLDVAQ